MSSKDKESKTLEKLRQFFRVSKTNPVNYRGRADFVLTPDIEKEISFETPINQRIKALKELGEIVQTNRLEDFGIEKILTLVKDLVSKDVETEHRHAALGFLKCLAQGQYERLSLLRKYFFQIIKKHDVPEDTGPSFELLQVLTQNGRDIHQLEEEIGAFLATWLPAVAAVGRIADYLDLLVNFIKCNSAYVDEGDVLRIVEFSCFICCWSQDQGAVENCLKVMGTVVCYSELPNEALSNFVAALCRKVNAIEFTLKCWKIMRDLLGTHMGHSALFAICKFLQDSSFHGDFSLLRGAVFFINMGLWSDKKVLALKCTPTSVLPSLLLALECKHAVVVYEVVHSIQKLIHEKGIELHYPAWDIILDILAAVVNYVETVDVSVTIADDMVTRVVNKLHEILSAIEKLIELDQFNGSVSRVFILIDMSAKVRPESSVLRLITYLSTSIQPTRHEWLVKLDSLVDKYYKQEIRPNIRIKVIDVISNVMSRYRYIYEEELVERIIVTYLTQIDQQQDLCVRNVVAQLLVSVCTECDSKKCLDVLSILEKLLNRPFDMNLTNYSSEGDILDVKTVAVGLINIFHIKLHHLPAGHAIRIYKILVGHLENHYSHPSILNFNHNVFYLIFDLLLKLRVNWLGHVGLVESSGPKFSPYLTVESSSASVTSGSAPPSPAPMPFSLSAASKVIVSALRNEKDWRIINLLLQELPTVMQNKALFADKYGGDVGLLADALCAMVTDKTLNLPDSLKYTPPKLTRTEFQSCLFPVIAAISAYHTYLEPSQQARCIKCLECGLASKCASQCVLALTTCTLEMRDAMYKLLPEVLLNLSKISATVVIAIPILEFLSTLTSLPKVFASFVGDQYMSVFAIALPYTNPFKYNHYTVSLAHHVIAVWFLKCRLPFRRDFVKFITTGLKANAIVPFEEGQIMKSELAALNEDSTSRKRSSSLTEQGSRRRERPIPNASRLAADLRPPIDDALMNFHVELTETCIDLMARYTFSSCEARPTRSSTAKFLLNGGQSQTWLLGQKLITVTTSGCSQKPLKNNLCDRCWMVCRLDRDIISPEADTDREERRKDAQIVVDSQDGSSQEEPRRISEAKLERLILSALSDDSKINRDVCACWCQGWAEIHVRRPTGDISWIMRLQNESHYANMAFDLPLTDVSALFLPSHPKQGPVSTTSTEETTDERSSGPTFSTNSPQAGSRPVSIPDSPSSRQSSRESVEEEDDEAPGELDPLSGKCRNPVRRSNSSPEMSASWKNPFLKDKSGAHDESPKARVSCEAIPEEMTPPEAAIPWKPPTCGGRRREGLKLDVGLTVEVGGRAVKGPMSSGEIERHIEEPNSMSSASFVRDRSRTISVMSPVRKPRYELDLNKMKMHSPRAKDPPRSGVSPSFVFLQLFHSAHFGSTDEKPILISNNPVVNRAILAIDFIPPFETHKVGVIYVGPGQAGNESEILRNEFGSLRYAMFLQNLGTLINLKNADPQTTFLGGLDKNGVDGKFAYIWQDDVTQVTFHVATLMPNKESDPNCNAKKLHIGNDYVTIVYNESGEEDNFLKGQFNYANIVIEPLDMGSNRVTVKARDEIGEHIGHGVYKIVSDENLAILARQLALHANLAAEVSRSLKTKNRDPYASNWLERLRKIKRLRKKLLEIDPDETESHPPIRGAKKPEPIDDFTDYT